MPTVQARLHGIALFDSQVYILTKEEGGHHTPFFEGFRPQFYVRTTDVTGKIESFRADDDSSASDYFCLWHPVLVPDEV